MNDVLSFISGPSRLNLDATARAILLHETLVITSFILISITEESLPPYLAGNPPFITEIFLIASVLKTDTNQKDD